MVNCNIGQRVEGIKMHFASRFQIYFMIAKEHWDSGLTTCSVN